MTLKNILSSVYNAGEDIHSGKTVKYVCDTFLNGQSTDHLLQNYGQLTVGHMSPFLTKYELLNKPVTPELITPAITHGLQDEHFQGILKDVEPGYEIDTQNVTAGLIFRLGIIQHLGIMRRFAEMFTNAFVNSSGILNDADEYRRVVNYFRKADPYFMDILPASLPELSIKAHKDKANIKKDVGSAYRKSRKKVKGIYDVGDMLRDTMTFANSSDRTPEIYRSTRDGIGAMFLYGSLDTEPSKIKDLYSNTIEKLNTLRRQNPQNYANDPKLAQPIAKLMNDLWIATMYRGTAYYPVDKNLQVGIPTEYQFNIYSEEIDYIVDVTAGMRSQERRDENENADIARQLREIDYEDNSTNDRGTLKLAILQGFVPDFHAQLFNENFSDPSYTMLTNNLGQIVEQRSHPKFYEPVTKVDLQSPDAMTKLFEPDQKGSAYKTMMQLITPL